jgi:serine/threonine protein kinase
MEGCPALANGEVSKCEKHCQRKCDNDTIADSTNSGTAPYLAPECLSQFRFSHKSDVWAAGAVLLELATGTRVLQTDDTNADGLLGRCVEREGAPAAIKAHVDSALARNLPHMLSLEQVRKGVREDVATHSLFRRFISCCRRSRSKSRPLMSPAHMAAC